MSVKVEDCLITEKRSLLFLFLFYNFRGREKERESKREKESLLLLLDAIICAVLLIKLLFPKERMLMLFRSMHSPALPEQAGSTYS